MNIKILAFGIAKDIFGQPHISIETPENGTVASLRQILEEQYPELRRLASYMIAVNNEYGANETPVGEKDEIALIPPVSGG